MKRTGAKRGEISECTIPNYYRAIKLFCEMNDIILNWKKVARGLPRAGKAANDRAPTLEEIKKIIEYHDRRIKAVLYTMVSSGIRICVWDYLNWKHVIPRTMKIRKISQEQYFTFISPKAFISLKEWMDFRKNYRRILGDA